MKVCRSVYVMMKGLCFLQYLFKHPALYVNTSLFIVHNCTHICNIHHFHHNLQFISCNSHQLNIKPPGLTSHSCSDVKIFLNVNTSACQYQRIYCYDYSVRFECNPPFFFLNKQITLLLIRPYKRRQNAD